MPKGDPRELQLVSPVELTIEAAASDGAEKPALVHVAAYGGGLMTVAGFGPVVLDVEGIESPERVPLLADHENRIDAVLGSGLPVRGDGRLAIDGTLSRTSERARRVIDLHRDGVPLQASVGAEPLETERIAKGRQVVVNGRTIRAEAASFLLVRRSRLKHVAIVANGADGSTSVNIAAQAATQSKEIDMEFATWIEAQGFAADTLTEQQQTSLQAMFDASKQSNGTTKIEAASAVAELRAELATETARVGAIRKLCGGKHADIEAQAIKDGWDETKTELAVVRADRPRGPAIHAGSWNDSPQVIEAALCISRGHAVEKQFKPEVIDAADRQYRNLGFQQLFMMAAAANGYAARPGETIHSGNIREVLSYAFPPRTLQASFSTMSLPGILQNVANKELLVGYTEEDQTWREVATVKSVSDFKEITSYRMLDNMEYEELPKHGEIKHGSLGEESYTRQVRTYAKMFMLDRVDIINDDLSAFDDLRTRVGAGAAKKLNNVFWSRFMDNAAFFTAGRANYVTGADTVLGLDGVGLQKAITAFRKLRSPAADGKKRVVGGRPELLLVPPELEFIAQRLFQSTNVNSGGAATAETIPDANIHAGKYRPVVCDWLSDADFTGNSATAWYLFRAPRNLAAIVVSFLNGQQNPTVDMAEADFNQLGVQFRGYHDFGVDLAEYLAGIKSKGAA